MFNPQGPPCRDPTPLSRLLGKGLQPLYDVQAPWKCHFTSPIPLQCANCGNFDSMHIHLSRPPPHLCNGALAVGGSWAACAVARALPTAHSTVHPCASSVRRNLRVRTSLRKPMPERCPQPTHRTPLHLVSRQELQDLGQRANQLQQALLKVVVVLARRLDEVRNDGLAAAQLQGTWWSVRCRVRTNLLPHGLHIPLLHA